MSSDKTAQVELFLQRVDSIPSFPSLPDYRIAEMFNVRPQYFSQIRQKKKVPGPKMMKRLNELEQGGAENATSESNAKSAPLPLRAVPVVSWARAGEGINYEDLCRQLEEWASSDTRDRNAFAVILEGDSMEPRFFAGDRVVVAPNSEPRNGDYVLARLRDGGVLFKRFHQTGPEGHVIRLTSLNANYQPKEIPREEFFFIYPAVEVLSKLRR